MAGHYLPGGYLKVGRALAPKEVEGRVVECLLY
jgi:hypothetical protein